MCKEFYEYNQVIVHKLAYRTLVAIFGCQFMPEIMQGRAHTSFSSTSKAEKLSYDQQC
jgi:hypothetical protein